MDEYWDSQDQWSEEARCLVCGGRVSDDVFVCSVSCADLQSLTLQVRGLREDEYANR